MSTRSDVLQAAAVHELDPRHRAWLADQQHTVDAQGYQVLCAFAPHEPAHEALTEIRSYEQPVIVCTLIGGDLAVSIVDPQNTPVPYEQGTVAELVHAVP